MKYNEVLDKLQNTEPFLNDSEELTDRIMQQIEQMALGAGRTRMMRISGILSGVAASALIGLLTYETLRYPVLPVENHSIIEVATTSQLFQQKITELNLREKEEIIKYVVKNKESQRIKKEKFKNTK